MENTLDLIHRVQYILRRIPRARRPLLQLPRRRRERGGEAVHQGVDVGGDADHVEALREALLGLLAGEA